MKDKKRLIAAIVFIVLAVALFVTGLIILPNTVVMQVHKDGTTGTMMAKIWGLLIPLALSTAFPILYYYKGKPKDLVVSIAGIAIYGFIFYFNL